MPDAHLRPFDFRQWHQRLFICVLKMCTERVGKVRKLTADHKAGITQL